MAIYTKQKCTEMLLEMGQEVFSLEDGVFQFLSLKEAGLFKEVIGSIKQYKKDIENVKKAIEIYPTLYKDCIPLGDFERKNFKIKPYSNDPDTEMTEEEVAKADKFGMDRVVCFYLKSKLMMQYTYKVEYGYNCSTSRLFEKFLSSKVEKHKAYYTSCFLLERSMYNKDVINWAYTVLKEHDSSNYSPTKPNNN